MWKACRLKPPRLIVALAILLLGGEFSTQAEDTTAIGKLAATLKPGEWGELKSTGYDQDTLMRGDDILAYSGRAAWDGKSQQVLFIGQVHLKGPPSFITYSTRENTWRRQPTPPWAESLKWFHAYENNASDIQHGQFYHHSSASGLVHKYVVAKNEWSTLPELNASTGHGTALEFFPEMQGLVRALNGEVWFWAEQKNEWSRLATMLPMGPYHNFACYSPRRKVVLFGGGNGSGAIHILNADGTITTGKSSPVELGVGRSLNVVDPVSGELLVLSKDRKFLAYDAGNNMWMTLSSVGVPFPNYAGHSVSAAPIETAGVVLFFSSRPQGMKTAIYKHAENPAADK